MLFAANAQRLGVPMHVAQVADSFNHPSYGLFDEKYMNALYEHGVERAKNGTAFETLGQARARAAHRQSLIAEFRAADQARRVFGAVNFTDSFQVSQIVRKNSGKKTTRLTNGDVILSMMTPTQATANDSDRHGDEKSDQQIHGRALLSCEDICPIVGERAPDFKP